MHAILENKKLYSYRPLIMTHEVTDEWNRRPQNEEIPNINIQKREALKEFDIE